MENRELDIRKGVTKKRTRLRTFWVAQIVVHGTNYNLGGFDNIEDAAKAYDNAAYYLHHAVGFPKNLKLNFEGDYLRDSSPEEMTERTQEVIDRVRNRHSEDADKAETSVTLFPQLLDLAQTTALSAVSALVRAGDTATLNRIQAMIGPQAKPLTIEEQFAELDRKEAARLAALANESN